jgi:3',5'-cyclic AMP phosphodiesterase CpdA
MNNIESLRCSRAQLASRLTPSLMFGVTATARRTLCLAACVLVSLTGTIPTHASSARRDCRPEKSVRFAVLSDTHLDDARLGTSGSAFQAYLLQNPNLAALSQPILDATLADIIRSRVQFVIISGDLTKDGEVVNHRLMVRSLEKLERAGIQVFVVPGNHDINNHDAASYSGDIATPIPSASPQLFRSLYHRFGYGQAIDHAPDSLSYVAEPAPGLWLLALDSVKWAESANEPHPLTSGRLTDATMAWALKKLHQAQVRGKQVVAFMHHGVNMHFLAEPTVFADYLVDNWPVVGAQLAGAGLKVIFTGHYHAQDASFISIDAEGNPQPSTLCDILTSSLVQFPCAHRIAELDGAGQLHVQSRRVTKIAADLGGVPFQQYAEDFLRDLLPYPVTYQLETQFGLDAGTAAFLEPYVADALVANYAGDESPSEETLAELGMLPEPFQSLLIYGFWMDLSPGDNTLVVPVGN